jgi:hypothetical protein
VCVCEGLEFCFGLVWFGLGGGGGGGEDLRGLRGQQRCETRVKLGEGRGRKT